MIDQRYPMTVTGELDQPLSRWQWLVKWLLTLPHYIILALLWLVFLVITVIAWVATLVTGRYPDGLFDVAVGILRWSWRVGYYSYATLGTDRYPPFTFDDRPAYPARLEIPHPGRQARVQVLFRWVLVLPHVLVVAILLGGVSLSGQSGLLGLLVLFAAATLLFAGRYPRDLHGLVVGLNRWGLRVIAYATLLTNVYPPFRLDAGPTEPSPDPLPPLPQDRTQTPLTPTPA